MRRLILCAGLLGALASAAQAVPIVVTNFDWLLLRPNQVTPFIGGGAGGGSGFGIPDDFRWGNHVWLPNDALAGGDKTYYAGVSFDRSREVNFVHLQWWAQEGTTIKKVTIQGSSDGVHYADIGSYSYASYQGNNSRFTLDVDVTPGVYKSIRAVMNPGDYQDASTNYGGPGFYAIAPFGDGQLNPDEVDWAAGANNLSGHVVPGFGTTLHTQGPLEFNGTAYINSLVDDNEGARTGNFGNWPTYDNSTQTGPYVQVDLQAARNINSVLSVWDSSYSAAGFQVFTSLDGITFTPVTGLSAYQKYDFNNASLLGASGYTFDPTLARYVRAANYTSSGNGYELINQLIVYGIPEPASLSFLILGGMACLARRRNV